MARRTGPFLSDKPGHDRSLSFWYDNAGKSGLTSDINVPSDRDRLLQLLQSCDIMLESCAPGELDAAGLGYEALSRANPSLIVASITGFGLTGDVAQIAHRRRSRPPVLGRHCRRRAPAHQD